MNQTSQTVQTKHTYIEYKKYLYILITAILITDLTIILNIPYLRQILGFLFLTILPGLLILQILKLDKLEFTERSILTVGLSISFLMFFGLLINNLLFSLGYGAPLSTISLLILFNLAFIVFTVIEYKVNKEPTFSPPNLNLTTSERAFLVVPILFPALTIFGMHVMNTTDNNVILMFLLFLIPTYVIFVCFFNHKFSERLYPVVIFLISISLVLLMALRSNHLIGIDTHQEYYLYQTTLDNLHWQVLTVGNQLDACLSISILPTIYQSILSTSPKYLYKILYPVLYSISPLAIYVLSKKYIGESYGFLVSCFFMFQISFLTTTANSRTNLAILFIILAMIVLFDDKIELLKKRILFIVFMASCMVSHYATTYIFFFVMLGFFIGIAILSKRYTFKKTISPTIIILFFAMFFFWYSQVTESAFNCGVNFISNTITQLNSFFIAESRGAGVTGMFGKDIIEKSIPQKMEFVFAWLTLALIGIGVVTLIRRYKEMSFPELRFKKPDFLKEKFEVGYFLIALACFGLMVAVVLLPYISAHYDLGRMHAFGLIILSVFFVIGGIILSKNLSLGKKALLETLLANKKRLRKNISQQTFKKHFASESVNEGKTSQGWAYLIILLVLIPHFLCVSGVMYQMFGVPCAITLNSEGEQYNKLYIHGQEIFGAKWLESHNDKKTGIYTVRGYATALLLSQRGICSYRINKNIKKGNICFKDHIAVNGKLLGTMPYNMTEYTEIFDKMSKVYATGGSEIWVK